MIAIDVELLTGRFVATSFNDRYVVEWPPHPARLFSALVAVAEELGYRDERIPSVLERLAAQHPPQLIADGPDTPGRRSVMNVYVPNIGPTLVPTVHSSFAEAERASQTLQEAGPELDARSATRLRKNVEKLSRKAMEVLEKENRDATAPSEEALKSARSLLPATRNRQPRTFPTITPCHRHVTYVWPAFDPDDDDRRVLEDLVAQVTYLGHSSSLVWCRLADDSMLELGGRERWVPDENGSVTLRVVEAGQVERLRASWNVHRGTLPRVLPCRFQRYRVGDARAASIPRSLFGSDWLVFREVPDEKGERLLLRLTRAVDIAAALRGALMRYAVDPPPPLLSGHALHGGPAQTPHAAFVSLADVASRWASGAILGAAVVMPRDRPREEYEALLEAIGRWETEQKGEPLRLLLGRVGVMLLERIVDPDPRITLRPQMWCGPARHWGSVTPVALDQNPGDLGSSDPDKAARAMESAQSTVALACERIGLPEPAKIGILRRSVFDGCPEARRFMPFPNQPGAIRRVCVHVELIFDQAVEGPILLGAGRYQGLGLFRPVRDSWTRSS